MPAPSPALLHALADLLGPSGFHQADDDLRPWLTDWRGRWSGQVPAMLSPASTDQVAEIVRLCAAERAALVPQGGNTSMVGGATPDADGGALLLSLRRMRAIRRLEPDLAVCEAGVILEQLHEAASRQGSRFPLTLGAKGSATICGLVSTNAGGTQVLRFGTMRALVLGVEAVLADGSVYHGLAALKKDNRGYNLSQLLVGAEGTLGIVTAAALKLVPALSERSVAWVGLAAADALALLRRLEARMGPAIESFELVPRNALDLVLRHVPDTRAPLDGAAAWNVLVEAAGPRSALEEALADAHDAGLVTNAALAASEADAAAFWRLRDSISEAERRHGPAAKHDISVPVAEMPAFMVDTARAVEQRFPGTEVIAFGHLGDGNIHFNVAAPVGSGADWPDGAGRAVSAFVHDRVTAAGGSISAEHGIGQMKRDELARLGDPVHLSAMRAIKRALDPDNIMNPGKLVPPAPGLAESRRGS